MRALIICLLVSLAVASPLHGKHEDQKKNNAFDFLLFTQQSTEGYCRSTGHCVTDKVRDYWTIHGLWPSNATTWPEDCDPSHPFDPSTIADARDKLDRYWPSVTDENSNSFWSHEWSKHGTCAKEIASLSGEYKYFTSTLDLYQKWNLTKYLEDAKIFPDNEKTYSAADIESALDADLQGRVNIVCKKVKDLDHPLLVEIRFCLSKNLDVIDCPAKDQVCHEGPIYYIKKA